MLLVWMGWVAGLTWGGIVEAPPLSAHLTHLLNPDLAGHLVCMLLVWMGWVTGLTGGGIVEAPPSLCSPHSFTKS